MANLNKVVYLSNAQAQELFANGTITVDGVTVTYSPNDLYVTPSGEVTDVQVNGSSVLGQNGVATIPTAGTSAAPNGVGVVGVNSNYGIAINTAQPGRYLYLNSATSAEVKAGTAPYKAVAPYKQHEALFYGFAKLAGADMASSSNPVGTFTDDAKFAIAEMLGLSYEKLLYRDDTFGNIWTEYQPTGIDLENNAIILEDATGLPTDAISLTGTGYLILKPSTNTQYGSMPTELYTKSRIKAIGDNKVQFYNTDGTLVTFTSTDYIDMSKFKLIYRPNNNGPTVPSYDGFDTTHKIHVRLSGYLLENAEGVKAFDASGNGIDGSSYSVSRARIADNAFGSKANNTFWSSNAGAYDGYANIIGNRSFDTSVLNNKYAYSQYDIWFWPNAMYGGNEFETKTIIWGVDNSNKNKLYHPCITIGHGYTSAPIAKVAYNRNSGSAWIGPNAKFEVWDCGSNFN